MNTLYSTWDETTRKDFRTWLTNHLRFSPVTVTFTKKDGTERKLYCTLKDDLTKEYEKKTDRVKAVNEETCPVFDLEKQEWRSFRFDSVIKVEFPYDKE